MAELEDTGDDKPWLGIAPWPPGKYALDTEHDESETEPELGATDEIDQEASWQHDRQATHGCAEPSLGAPESIDQTHGNQGTGNEEEEPTLGSSVIGNHEHWGASSVDPDTDECEPETQIRTTRTRMSRRPATTL